MLSFEEVKSVLIAIQSNPELHQSALKECADLYVELFVGSDSEYTGVDILAYLNLSDPCHQSVLEDYLVDILVIEKEIAKIKLDLNTEDKSLIYCELLKREAAERLKYVQPSYHEQSFDSNMDDDDKWFDDDMDDRFYQTYEDYECEAQDRLLRIEVKEQFDRLIEVFKSTVYVQLVNYKGECEAEAMLIKSVHLRKFYSKYNYGE